MGRDEVQAIHLAFVEVSTARNVDGTAGRVLNRRMMSDEVAGQHRVIRRPETLVGARVERSGGADGTPNLARRDKLSNGHGLDLLRRVLLEGLHRCLFGYGNKLRSGLTVRDGMVLSLNASSESDFKGVADTNELRDYECKDEPDEDEERKSRGEGC